MMRICTELVPTYTTRDGRACGYHRAWVEEYDHCILGTPYLAADPSGMLTIIDRTPPALREARDAEAINREAAAIAATVYRATKGGRHASS
jgi:hypothetical protein